MLLPLHESARILVRPATTRVLANARRVLRCAGLLAVLAVAVALGACGPAASPPQPPPPPTKAQCQKAFANAKGPVFCIPSPATRLFVVGLPAAHGWRRGDWVLVEVLQKDFSKPTPAAMVEVVNAYPDAVEVHLLYQAISNTSLDGAAARLPGKDERVRLGKFVGRIAKVELTDVQLDIGSDDRVSVGDVYQVLSVRDHTPIGRLRITEVAPLSARAVKIDVREELLPQMDVVYLKDGTADAKEPVRIVVVNFDPHDSQSEGEAKTGRTFAKDFAGALAAAADKNDMVISYAENERVPFGTGDAEGHKKAQQIGERLGADVVVWGQMSCNERACALPRFTVVNPSRLRQRHYGGADIVFDRDASGGFRFQGAAPDDPLALAAAILGSAAYDAHRYADAAFYLERAVAKGVLQGEDELHGRMRLAYAMFVRGQTVAARAQAETLVARAQAARSALWVLPGRAVLARVDQREGNVEAARNQLVAIHDEARTAGHDGELGFALHTLAVLETQQGQVEEAKKLYKQSLDLWRRIGDVQSEAATLHQFAFLEVQQGRAEEAGKLYQQSLEVWRRTGNVKGEAAALNQLAGLEKQQGRVEEAGKLYQQSLDLERRIGDVESEAATLHNLADLEAQQGRVEGARKLYQQSLDLKRRIGHVEGEAATLHQLAMLEARQGRVEEARKLYEQSLDLWRRIGHVKGEAATLHGLATLESADGRVEQAKKLCQQSLDLRRRIGDVSGEAATLHELALLEARQGRVEEARKLYEQSLDLKRRIGDVQGEIVTLSNLAVMDYGAGKRAEARAVFVQALERARAIRRVEHQAEILDNLAYADFVEGDLAQARARWNEAKALFEKLQAAPRVADLEQSLAELAAAEKVADAWKTYETLLADGGVLVNSVLPDGQAAKAGLEAGDILVRHGKTRLDKPETLHATAKAADPTKTFSLELLRGAKKLTVQVRGGLLGVSIDVLPPKPQPKPPAPTAAQSSRAGASPGPSTATPISPAPPNRTAVPSSVPSAPTSVAPAPPR